MLWHVHNCETSKCPQNGSRGNGTRVLSHIFTHIICVYQLPFPPQAVAPLCATSDAQSLKGHMSPELSVWNECMQAGSPPDTRSCQNESRHTPTACETETMKLSFEARHSMHATQSINQIWCFFGFMIRTCANLICYTRIFPFSNPATYM